VRTVVAWQAGGDPVKIFDLRGSVLGPWDDIDVQWHVPSDAEQQFAEELLAQHLDPAIASLATVAKGTGDPAEAPGKSAVRVSLMVVRNVVRTGLQLLPELPGDGLYQDADCITKMDLPAMALVPVGCEPNPAAATRRATICETVHSLVQYYLEYSEDDTKALKTAVKIIKVLLCQRGIPERKYTHLMRSYDMVKRQYESIAHGGKLHTRGLCVERARLQHLRRLNKRRVASPYHPLYRALVTDLVRLGTSRYAKVRAHAQTALYSATAAFSQARHDIVSVTTATSTPHTAQHQTARAVLLCTRF
jgi:hypothetical protein